MKDIWNNFDESLYEQLIVNLDGDVASKKKLLESIIKEADVEFSHQKELILDQLFNTMIFIIDMNFNYDLALQIFKLVVGEFASLMEVRYDYKAEERLRSWLSEHVKMNTIVERQANFKKITKYMSTSMFSDLEAYHYAFNHLPKMEVHSIPVYVDTPIRHFHPLT